MPDTGPPPDGKSPPDPEYGNWVRDWLAIWHSEASALASDREAQEIWSRGVQAWAALAEALAPPRDAPGQSRPVPPARPATAGPAPARPDAAGGHADDGGDGGSELHRLRARVADLERRLAGLGG